jgi:hypothetical protein
MSSVEEKASLAKFSELIKVLDRNAKFTQHHMHHASSSSSLDPLPILQHSINQHQNNQNQQHLNNNQHQLATLRTPDLAVFERSTSRHMQNTLSSFKRLLMSQEHLGTRGRSF